MYLGVIRSADKNLFFQNISIEQENSENWIANIMRGHRLCSHLASFLKLLASVLHYNPME